jgi:hypothetical protein
MGKMNRSLSRLSLLKKAIKAITLDPSPALAMLIKQLMFYLSKERNLLKRKKPLPRAIDSL